MKISLIFALFVLFSSFTAFSQDLVLPKVSPKATIMQTIGLTTVTVNYHTPGVKGREIWGKLVPFGEVWRTGANEATTITFSDNVKINGASLAAGTYSLFTLPESMDSWVVIFNKETQLWGTDGYKKSEDVLRVHTLSEKDIFHETLFFSFTNIKSNSGVLNVNWDKLRIPFTIEVEVEKKALTGIEESLKKAGPDNWKIYAQATAYMLQNGKEPEKALEWINKSISINNNFYNNWLKAQLLAENREYTEAVNLVKKALKLGEKDKSAFRQYEPDMELALKAWKTKMD